MTPSTRTAAPAARTFLLLLSIVLQPPCATAAPAAAAPTAEITIRAVDAANQPVRNAYLALVRNDAPWREPAAERLAHGAVTFDIPPGTYRIVAGAPGFATYYGDAVQFDSAREATVNLVRLGAVAGRVVGADGSPIAGARIGMFWEFLADHPHRLSALGERHLRGNAFVVADRDGIFELPIGVARATFVTVEADRKVPRIIDGVSAGSSLLRLIELQAGGALTLHIAPPNRAGWIHLAPAAGQPFNALPLDRALTLWRRPVATSITWQSLPATKLDVLFEPDDGAGEIVALKTVTITRDEATIAALDLPPAPAAASEASRIIRFMVSGKQIGSDRLTVKRWTSASAVAVPARVRQVSGGELVEVNAPCADHDRFTFESSRLVGASSPAGGCAETSAVTLHDRATLRFKISTHVAERLPRVGKATISDCATHHYIAELPFLIADDGAATLYAPAGCVSVAATAGKFAPFGWPRLELAAGPPRDLGIVTLNIGTALFVRVVASDGHPASGVTVSVARVDDLAPLRNVLDVAAVAPVARGVTDAKGWLALNAIPDGRLVLALRRPGVDYPQLSDVVRVAAGDGRRTIDLTLEEPARVSVTVAHPRDLPSVNAMSFEMLPLPDNRWPHALAFRARPRDDGSAEFTSVPPGAWRISVRGTVGESTLTSLGYADVALTPGASVAQTIAIQAVVARGHVTRNGAPVQGVITLKPTDDTPREPLTAKLDADGAFILLAPTPGDYRAIVAEPGKQTTAARSVVHVARDAKDLDIALPSGRIEGRVVNEQGEGVSRAHISGVTRVPGTDTYEIAEAHAVSRNDGSFSIDGVRDGEWALTASTEKLSSEAVLVSLAENEIRSGATLRLRPKESLSGKLLGADGAPVAGAVVSAALPPPFSGIATGLLARTDANGEFTFSPPPGAPDVANVVVRTSDRVAMAVRTRLSDGMNISLPPSLGAVRLTNASGKWARDAVALHALVAPDGGFLNPLAGGVIAPSQGRDVLTTPRVPAQQYRYVIVRTPAERALLESGQGTLLPALRTINVQANSVIDINVGDIPLH